MGEGYPKVGTPPSVQALATQWVVWRLRSCRRTFLFDSLFSKPYSAQGADRFRCFISPQVDLGVTSPQVDLGVSFRRNDTPKSTWEVIHPNFTEEKWHTQICLRRSDTPKCTWGEVIHPNLTEKWHTQMYLRRSDTQIYLRSGRPK